jgi:hypothetical protein
MAAGEFFIGDLIDRSNPASPVADDQKCETGRKMKEKIDEFVAAFFPEMQRIQSLTESDTNKLKGVRELGSVLA